MDVSHRGDFGGTLGGYIVKDRLWFFGAIDCADERRDTTVIRADRLARQPADQPVIPATIKSTSSPAS